MRHAHAQAQTSTDALHAARRGAQQAPAGAFADPTRRRVPTPGPALAARGGKSPCTCGGGCPRCKEKSAAEIHLSDGIIEHRYSGESACSPDWYGDTSPEMDQNTGNFTGELTVMYNDAALKDPCVRECVEQHEKVHVQQLTPIVKRVHACDVAAGNDDKKSEQCNLMWNREALEPGRVQKWECEAYQKSFTCLTLKILDSKSPCSKSPHREEIQKHRNYEACEMKRSCKEAGTPGAGIPIV